MGFFTRIKAGYERIRGTPEERRQRDLERKLDASRRQQYKGEVEERKRAEEIVKAREETKRLRALAGAEKARTALERQKAATAKAKGNQPNPLNNLFGGSALASRSAGGNPLLRIDQQEVRKRKSSSSGQNGAGGRYIVRGGVAYPIAGRSGGGKSRKTSRREGRKTSRREGRSIFDKLEDVM